VRPPLASVVVLLRRPGDSALQGLRTAVSLALGDRPVTLLVAAGAGPALLGAPGSEVAQNLQAILAAGMPLLSESEGLGRHVTQAELMTEFLRHPLRQVF
jgi:hypothetical protein